MQDMQAEHRLRAELRAPGDAQLGQIREREVYPQHDAQYFRPVMRAAGGRVSACVFGKQLQH